MSAIQSTLRNVQAYFRDLYDCYMTAMKGFHVTLKVMVEKPVTKQYPEESTGVTPQFRGFHVFNSHACNGCGLCAKRCPVECIAVEKVGKGKDARVTRYAIDYTKCLFCSLCCEVCPHDAIQMGHSWYLEASSRDDCYVEFEILPAPEGEPALSETAGAGAPNAAPTGPDAPAKEATSG